MYFKTASRKLEIPNQILDKTAEEISALYTKWVVKRNSVDSNTIFVNTCEEMLDQYETVLDWVLDSCGNDPQFFDDFYNISVKNIYSYAKEHGFTHKRIKKAFSHKVRNLSISYMNKILRQTNTIEAWRKYKDLANIEIQNEEELDVKATIAGGIQAKEFISTYLSDIKPGNIDLINTRIKKVIHLATKSDLAALMLFPFYEIMQITEHYEQILKLIKAEVGKRNISLSFNDLPLKKAELKQCPGVTSLFNEIAKYVYDEAIITANSIEMTLRKDFDSVAWGFIAEEKEDFIYSLLSTEVSGIILRSKLGKKNEVRGYRAVLELETSDITWEQLSKRDLKNIINHDQNGNALPQEKRLIYCGSEE